MADHGHGEDQEIAGGQIVPPGEVHVHIHPASFYAKILGALLFFTVLTVLASYVDIDGFLALGHPRTGVGVWNLLVAIGIATAKASLVVLFFMHLKDDKRFNALVFIGGLLFIGVFFAYTMNDTATRGTTGDAFNGVTVDPVTGERAPGGIEGEIHGEALEAGLETPEEEAAEEPGEQPGEANAEQAAETEEAEALGESPEEAEEQTLNTSDEEAVEALEEVDEVPGTPEGETPEGETAPAAPTPAEEGALSPEAGHLPAAPAPAGAAAAQKAPAEAPPPSE